MVTTNRFNTSMRYRLLDTTRVYALDISIHEAGFDQLAARHAAYYQRWLEQADSGQPDWSDAAERTPQLADFGNVRAALEWCFSASGNAEIAVGLAAAAGSVFLAMSLFTECHRWSERALVALNDARRGGYEEMQLQAALGLSLIFTQGLTEAARAALNRGLAIAEERSDALSQLRLLSPLHMFHFRLGDFKTALDLAKRSAAVSEIIGDPAGIALAHNLFGHPLHLTGELGRARLELEAALQPEPAGQQTRMTYLGFDNLAGGALARTLWLQGLAAQATVRARQTVNQAARTNHPVPLSIALIWSISVFLWTGDLQSAEEYVDRFIILAESHSLRPYLAVARGYQGELAIRRGDAQGGIESLRGCLEDLHAARYELLTTAFYIPLVQGLAVIDRGSEALTMVDKVIRRVEADGGFTYLPELLRIKGGLLLSVPRPNADDAERCFIHALELSRQQGALAWELRTATDLATLLAAQGRLESAQAVLQPVFGRFEEGFDTADLIAAQRVLKTLS
jgi:tetratricopeptide (TPR) repeat protein